MKLSEFTTDKAADVLCEVGVYALNIVEDAELMAALKSGIGDTSGMTVAEMYAVGVQKISTLLPMVLKKHKDDVFGILAALNETGIDEIKKQKIIKTMEQVREEVMDEELLLFFKSCAPEARK